MSKTDSKIELSEEQVVRLQKAFSKGATLTPHLVSFFAGDCDLLDDSEHEKVVLDSSRDFGFRPASRPSIFDGKKIAMKPIRGNLCI